MEKAKITLSAEEMENIVRGDSDEYEIVHHQIIGHWRHGTNEIAIVERVSDNRFFSIDYQDSVKDECDFRDMNFGGDFHEVFPVSKTVVEYK